MKNIQNKTIQKKSKRMIEAYKVLTDMGISDDKEISLKDAIDALKKCPAPKFDCSVDLAISLNIDATKSDQTVRGMADMPHGTGRKVKIAVFAQSQYEKQAMDAKADITISDEESAKDFIKGTLDCDYCVATPDMMSTLVKWGVSKVLGPKGLMPNAKVGTVTFDVKTAIENLKRGQAMFKNDKTGRLHSSVGLKSFDTDKLVENAQSFIDSVKRSVPSSVKPDGFVKAAYINMTMLPGIKIKL